MTDDSATYCPLCGNKINAGITKCPVCATDLLSVFARRAHRTGPAAVQEDYLHRELPEVELPVTKSLCPQCGMELQGDETKCPRCSIPLVGERPTLECPGCGAAAPAGAKICPNCGAGFEKISTVPGPPPIIETPSGPEPEIRTVPSRAQVPPVLRTPAVTAGQGLTNGRGSINGTGLVNGTGITNGTRAEANIPSGAMRRRSLITRWQFLSVLVVVVVVISSFVYISYANEKSALVIDGQFGDWSHVEKFGMDTTASAASINVNQWAVQTEMSRLYLYVKVQGGLMSTGSVDSFYLFVDSDNSAQTGYQVSSLGADYMLEIDGWNGTVQSTSLSEYISSSDHFNWTAWSRIGTLSSAISSSQLEAMADMPMNLGQDSRYLLLSRNALDEQATSFVVPDHGGSLVIRQEVISSNITEGTVAYSANLAVLRLTLKAEGAGGTVQSISPSVQGARLVSALGPISLKAGQNQTVDIAVDTSASVSGSLVSVTVSKSDVQSSFAEVSIVGDAVKAYVVSPPAAIVIDGAFGDWVGRTTIDTDSVPVANPDINIDATGAVNTTESSFFYVSVSGQMCNGSYVPMIRSKPTGASGGGGVIIPTRVTGEDVLRIYIDSDRNVSTGMPVSLSTKVIGADYEVDIEGMNGEIDRTLLLAFDAGQWTQVPGAHVDAANDAQRIEIGVLSSALGGSSSIDFIIETTDWRGGVDLATSVPQGSKGYSTGLAASIESWLVDGSTTSSSATATSIQRKLFYDGTNFWSFYWDGSNTVYRYSTDNGQTWSAGVRAFKTTGVNEVSIWYDSAANIVYAVGDTAAASANVYVQGGTVTPSTHTISWAVTDSLAAVSTISMGGKHTFICEDTLGYLWIMSTNCTSATPTYGLTVIESKLVGKLNNWQWSGAMLATSVSSASVKGSVVPAGTGSDVWAVYTYNGNMASRKYTSGTWSSETVFFAAAKTASTDIAPPSIVVDTNGVLHCVYGDDHEQPVGSSKPHIYYRYNTGSGWSAALLLSSGVNTNGYKWPTISLDTSTGTVYVFWYDMQTNAIVGEKNVSGTWTALSFVQNTYAKQYLSSIYSAPNEPAICWQWTQNTTAPIQVVFDKIPEFSHVTLPVMLTLLLFVAYEGTARKKRGKS